MKTFLHSAQQKHIYIYTYVYKIIILFQKYISSVREIEKLGSAFYLKDKFQRTVSRLIEMRSN